MNDLISRQQAIDIVRNRVKRFTTACVLAVTEIEKLPSAQPERKKGKWIPVSGRLENEVECNQCHGVFWYWMGNYRFCPSCGADMRR